MSYKIGIDARMVGCGSGLGRYASKLLEYVLKYDTKNYYEVLVYKDESKFVNWNYGNYEVKEVDYIHYTVNEQLGFLNFLNKQNYDLVHFTSFNHPILYSRKMIITIHDLTLMFYPGRVRRRLVAEWGYKLTMKNAVWRADKLIAITEYTKQDMIKHLGADPNKIEVIYEAADEKIKPTTDQAEIVAMKKKYGVTKPYFLYLGQWRVHKNLVRLIEAFGKVREQGLDTQLVLVGKEDPRYPEVREAIALSKYKDDIIITGFVPDEDLSGLFSGAICFVFPTLYEGIGLPPLEAMYTNLPVIAANASCLPEVLGDAVLYFDPLDTDDMARVMRKVTNDEDLRRDLVAKGAKHVRKYSWEKMGHEIIDLYGRVLNNS